MHIDTNFLTDSYLQGVRCARPPGCGGGAGQGSGRRTGEKTSCTRRLYLNNIRLLFMFQYMSSITSYITCLFKKKLFEQSHSVDLCTENSVLFFEENWNLKVKAVRDETLFRN